MVCQYFRDTSLAFKIAAHGAYLEKPPPGMVMNHGHGLNGGIHSGKVSAGI